MHGLVSDPPVRRGLAASGAWLLLLAAVIVLAAMVTPAGEAHGQAGTKGLPPHLDTSGKPQSGLASYYRPPTPAKPTASGAKMDPKKLTAASKSLPLGTTAKVVNKDNGKSTAVTITDRGPFVKNRILDVSPKAATKLGMKTAGVSPVKVTPLHVAKAPVHAPAPPR
ncbi:MAG: septal ring lytic transglycosylase RlpA family protein [Caulobacteraceae bacterium]